MASRRFYELYGIDDGHDHKKNFLDQYRSPHNPLDPANHHGHGHGHGKGHDDDIDIDQEDINKCCLFLNCL